MRGAYNSAKAQSLSLQFIHCDPEKRKCKDEEEIKSYMKRKFILTLENSSVFHIDTFGK